MGAQTLGIHIVQEEYLVHIPGGFLERHREKGVLNPFANGFVWILSCVI